MDTLAEHKMKLVYRDRITVAPVAIAVVVVLAGLFPLGVPLDSPARGFRALAVVLAVLGLVMAMPLAMSGYSASS